MPGEDGSKGGSGGIYGTVLFSKSDQYLDSRLEQTPAWG